MINFNINLTTAGKLKLKLITQPSPMIRTQLFYSSALVFLLFQLITCSTSASLSTPQESEPVPSARIVPPMDTLDNYNYRQTDTLLDKDQFVLIAHPNRDFGISPQQVLEKLDRQRERILDFVEPNAKLPTITYHIYHSAEDKGLLTKNTNQAHVDYSNNSVHTIFHPSYENNFIEKENELYLRILLGKPKHRALELGLALHFTEQWQTKGYQFWGAKLHQADCGFTLAEILDNDNFDFQSSLQLGAMAGLLVDFLLEKKGKSDFIQQYASWSPNPATVAALELSWQAFLRDQLNSPTLAVARRTPTLPYLQGFNFAHEGYDIYNGYGSRLASQSLKRLQQLKTNAITIIPYSYMRNPRKATPIPVVQQAGTENDESIIRTNWMAHRYGMTTLLKPQVWLRGSWPGDVAFDTEAEWQQFFKNYSRWITHFAMLAEIHQFDMLCIGVEFEKATLTHPEEWKILIKKIRKLYAGPITYCANWGAEYEQLTFWKELDYMGISCYYPLSKDPKNISTEELTSEFTSILKKITAIQKKQDRPLLLTEIGFRSLLAPWVLPHAEPNGQPVSQLCQQRCYAAVFAALEKTNDIAGIFWWKWPSHLANEHTKGFSPYGKLAEEEVRRGFEKKQ